jgi:hypothetical protein
VANKTENNKYWYSTDLRHSGNSVDAQQERAAVLHWWKRQFHIYWFLFRLHYIHEVIQPQESQELVVLLLYQQLHFEHYAFIKIFNTTTNEWEINSLKSISNACWYVWTFHCYSRLEWTSNYFWLFPNQINFSLNLI